ncbi:oligosaccharide flippase family protein [Vibrio owensii]|uniref:lipopolysaccharide biosynthesis protein n=1 Tax=Vibrio owensii TaxID=696485 RepID=UPI0033932E29
MQINEYIYKLAKGTLIAQLMSLIAVPIMARLYGTNDIGLYYLILNVVNMFLPVISLRVEQAIIKENDISKKAELYSISIFIIFFMSVLVSSIYAMINDSNINSVHLVVIMSLLLIFNGIFQLNKCYFLSTDDVSEVSRIIISRTYAKFLLIILLGLIYGSFEAVIISEVISFILVYFLVLNKLYKLKFINIMRTKKLLIENKNYTVNDSLLTLINCLVASSSSVYIGVIYDLEYVAYFNMALTLVNLPNYHLGKAISESFLLYAIKKGKKDLFITLNRYLIIIFIVSSILYSILYFMSEEIVLIILGSDWQETGLIIKLLCIQMVGALLSSPVLRILPLFELAHVRIIIEGLGLLVIFVVMIICYFTNMDINIFIILTSSVRLLMYLTLIIFTRYYLRKENEAITCA